jgi:membrane dipeptidase
VTPTHEQTQAAALHKRAIVIDGLMIGYNFDPKYAAQVHAGGLTAGLMSLTGATPVHDGLVTTVRLIDRYLGLIEQSGVYVFATSVSDILRAKEAGKVALVFSLQTASILEDDLRFLRTLYRLGCRVLQPAYNDRNSVGSGAAEERDDGLSRFGKEVVAEAGRLGMIMDTAHCGEQTTLDTIETSEFPVIASHTACRALQDNPRNHSDRVIRRLGERGGVMGVTPFPPFVRPYTERPTLDDYLNHIDHAVQVAGIDHVGLGLDLNAKHIDEGTLPAREVLLKYPWIYGSGPNGAPLTTQFPYPVGIGQHDELPNVTEGLLRRGYAEEDVEKILGRNFLRVFRQVWKT